MWPVNVSWADLHREERDTLTSVDFILNEPVDFSVDVKKRQPMLALPLP